MDEKQAKLEAWAMTLQQAEDNSRAAFEQWLRGKFGGANAAPFLTERAADGSYVWDGAKERWEAWYEGRFYTLLEHAPRIHAASKVAALIHQLDALQPKQ